MTTSTSSRGDLSLARGFTFCPRERELTDLYLHRKINGEDLPSATGRFIHVADVYSAEPEKLTEKFEKAPGTEPAWYFFSPVRYVGGRKRNARGGVGRKSRTIDGGAGNCKHWWHSEKGEMPVKGGSDYGGYEQYFSYKVKNASTGKDERAGWIMTEYGISPEYGGGDLVLCKIHRSPRAVASEAEMTAVVPVSNHIVSSKKRKAAARDHHEDPMSSARPRHTVDQDEHQLQAASTVEDAMPPEDAADQHLHIGDEIIFDEDPMAEFKTKFPEVCAGVVGGEPVTEEPERYGAAGFTDHQPADQAAPLGNFFQNVEQDFRSLYQNDMVMPVGDLAMPPCAPAAQPEDAAATGFVQTVTGYEVPHQNYNDDGQMEASLGEEQTEPDRMAADEVIYGLPMIRRCSNDLTMPWRSTSSMSMSSFGLF